MNKELIALAKEEPFEFTGWLSKELIHNSHEPLRYYFWLCELQLWLLNNYGLSVEVHGNSVDELYAIKIHYVGVVKVSSGTSPIYDTYVDALEEALLDALKLIIRYGY